MTADEQVEKVARAINDADGTIGLAPGRGRGSLGGHYRYLARAAIAAMQPEPVNVTTVEELEALDSETPILTAINTCSMAGTLLAKFRGMGHVTVSMFPATVLYPRPTPEEGQLEELKAAVRAGVEHTVNTETQEGVGHTIDHWRGMHFADGRDAGIELLAEQVYAILDKDEVPEVPEVPEGKD